MKRFLMIIATALALAALPAAHGAETYAGIAVGVWNPDTDPPGLKTQMDNGEAGELRFGWQPGPAWALEVAAGGFHAEHQLPAVDVTESTLYVVSSGYLLASGQAFLALGNGDWRLGASAGWGFYWAEARIKDPPNIRRRENENDSGPHLGAHVRYAVTRRTSIGLDYRRVVGSPGDFDIDGAAVLIAADYRL